MHSPQPQRPNTQAFFEFLAELERLVATFQGNMHVARSAVHARHQHRGLAVHAVGVTEMPTLRLVDPDTPGHLDTAEETTRQRTNRHEIGNSQKELTERLRDRHWSW